MRLLAALLFFLLTCSAHGALFEAQLTREIERTLAETGQPGLAVAVVRDGKVVYQRAFGFRDREAKLPATTKTAFYTASSTKPYTALAAKLLSAEGKLDLDAPLSKTLPQLVLPPPLRTEQLSLRDLLTHRLGFEHFGAVFRTAYSGEWTDDQLFALLAKSSVARSREFSYDNLGYVLTGYAIRKATGEEWQDVLAKRVFQPLGMTSTTARASEAIKLEIAVPYATSHEGFLRAPHKVDATMHAAGGIYTSLEDATSFLRANMTDGLLGDKRIFPRAVMREVHAPQTNLSRKFGRLQRHSYGLGWYHADYEGDLVVHHFGGYIGSRAHYSFMPDRNLGVVVLSNSDADLADGIAILAYDLLIGKADAVKKLDEDIADFKASGERSKTRYAETRQKLVAEGSGEAKPIASYVGEYVNEDLGTIRVTQKGDALEAALGVLKTPLEHAAGGTFMAVWLLGNRPEAVVFSGDGLVWMKRTFAKK